MEVIVSHEHMDFDGLASIAAAAPLFPGALMVLSNHQSEQVQEYLALYRDHFPFIPEEDVNWEKVSHIITLDTSFLDRTPASFLSDSSVPVTVYDHHPLSNEKRRNNTSYHLETTGASITILLEEWITREWRPTETEATLFGLGLYTDTGSLAYPGTTLRDLKAAVYLMEHHMNLDVMQQFSEEPLSPGQQEVFQQYLEAAEEVEENGLRIITAGIQAGEYIGGLNVITSHLLETTGADAVITVTGMKNKIFIIGRSASARINLLPFMEHFHGGGHHRAGSASVKEKNMADTLQEVKQQIPISITPALTAEKIMSSPVKTITEDVRVDEAKTQLTHFGHNGFPVVNENNDLIGIISRRDIDKAVHHNLGHAPVKGYMSTNPITISKHTSFESIQDTMIQHNIGRLPVLDKQQMIGIVSRTDIIEMLQTSSPSAEESLENMEDLMKEQLPSETLHLLKQVGKTVAKREEAAYLIGGMVRDLLLGAPGEDIDIVVEGDAIALADTFAAENNGSTAVHTTFKTATVTMKSGHRLDFTTSRTEYYAKPAALPTVAQSNIKEDLFRRDFTINALAISLQPVHFGKLLDYFNGVSDINNSTLRVLHNLSFVEDPTRIVRGVRFEQRFGFKMSNETAAFIRHSVSAVASLSRSRIVAEFQYLFEETDEPQSLERLHQLGVLNKFFPGAEWDELSKKTLQVFLQSPEPMADLDQWFCIMLCLYLKNAHTIHFAEAVALTRKQKALVQELAYLLRKMEETEWQTLGDLHHSAARLSEEALIFAGLPPHFNQGTILDVYRQKRKVLPRLINGHDLKAAGLKPGPAYQTYLFELEQKTLDETITTRDQALRYIQHLAQQNDE